MAFYQSYVTLTILFTFFAIVFSFVLISTDSMTFFHCFRLLVESYGKP